MRELSDMELGAKILEEEARQKIQERKQEIETKQAAKHKPPLGKKYKAKPTSCGYTVVDETEPPKSKLKIKRMSEIEAKELEFLIEPYIPSGTFSIIAGQSGSTKTWMSLYLASIISTGNSFISDNPFLKREPRTVIYQSKENDYETVIRPRLDCLKANLDNIITIDDKDVDNNGLPLTLTDGRLEEAIITYKPSLVIFDPLQSYLGDRVDMHRANEVRPVLDKIIDLGTKYDCAFVIIMHLSKMSTVSALDRILGSADFRAAARSICIIGNDPEDPKRRILSHAKFNNGEFGQSIAYKIDSKDGVVIEGYCDLTEDDIVQSAKKLTEKESPQKDEAADFLYELVSKDGYIRKAEAEKLAVEHGIKERTLYRAKKELGLKSHQIGKGGNRISWWTLPDEEPPQELEQITL